MKKKLTKKQSLKKGKKIVKSVKRKKPIIKPSLIEPPPDPDPRK